MKVASVLFLAVMAAVLPACASKVAPSATTATAASNAPAWVDNPELEGHLTGVGSATKNPLGDKSMQRNAAVADARADLAKKVNARVKNAFEKATIQVTEAGGGNAQAVSDVASRIMRDTTQVLTDQNVSGTLVRQTWTDPADSTMWAYVVASKESVDQAMREAAKAQIQKEIARGNASLDDSIKKLDSALASPQN
jgi:hypothetical protein